MSLMRPFCFLWYQVGFKLSSPNSFICLDSPVFAKYLPWRQACGQLANFVTLQTFNLLQLRYSYFVQMYSILSDVT